MCLRGAIYKCGPILGHIWSHAVTEFVLGTISVVSPWLCVLHTGMWCSTVSKQKLWACIATLSDHVLYSISKTIILECHYLLAGYLKVNVVLQNHTTFDGGYKITIWWSKYTFRWEWDYVLYVFAELLLFQRYLIIKVWFHSNHV